MTKEEFKTIRQEAGLTQQVLADGLGVNIRGLQHWEMGDRPIPGPVANLMELLKGGKWKPKTEK